MSAYTPILDAGPWLGRVLVERRDAADDDEGGSAPDGYCGLSLAPLGGLATPVSSAGCGGRGGSTLVE